jgi:SAM-dependent methyltransferase
MTMRVFDFGSNWQAFSEQHIDRQRITVAATSLQSLLRRNTLQDTSFLDIGCGSGLFSIAAYQLGAQKVMGVDINPHCIAVSNQNRQTFAPEAPIIFRKLSVLDVQSLQALGIFDLVYAWGSLHHTGAMWEAIHNVTKHVAPGGTLVLAIYNKHITSPVWKRIKWLYNQLPGAGQRFMTILFAGVIYIAKLLATRRNPLEKERGMSFWYDVVDWIGGYPYEYATPEEVQEFMYQQGFILRHYIHAQVPTGCNEFVFERPLAAP